MSFLVSKSQPSLSEAENNSTEDQEDQKMLCGASHVTSHVLLKPAHPSQTLDKDVVLRRIRQRKRVNKLRAALQGFIGAVPVSSKSDEVPVRWVDDAFAAL